MPRQHGFKPSRSTSLRPGHRAVTHGLKLKEGTMNRLGIFLVGAAIMTGGSALASAQAVKVDVAYRDRDHDRDRDRHRYDRDHDRDRYRYDRDRDRRYRDHDRDRRDYDRGYYNGNRRWNGHRWQFWDGYRWR